MLDGKSSVAVSSAMETGTKVYETERKTFVCDAKNNEFVSELVNPADKRDSFTRRMNQVIDYVRDLEEKKPGIFKKYLKEKAV